MSYNLKLPYGGYGRERVNMIVLMWQTLESILDLRREDDDIVITQVSISVLQRVGYLSKNVT